MTRRWLIMIAPALVSATVALATPSLRLGPSAVSSAVYPAQEIPIVFDHASHLGGRGLECEDCHDVATTSRSPSDNLLPREEACVTCHAQTTRIGGRGQVEIDERCAQCHPGQDELIRRTIVPPSHLRFSHADHQDEGCERCHTRVRVRGLATSDDLPGMQLCLGCHDGRRVEAQCRTCHLTEPDGRLRTLLGGEQLQPPRWMDDLEHDATWVQRHSRATGGHIRLCRSCHQDHECLACHDGNVRPREVHPGDWQSVHSVEARAGEIRCQSCHRGQSFCRTCHLRSGVSWGSSPGTIASTSNAVHQDPTWAARPTPRHAREARRALTTCVSCHSGQDCVSCHALINPHPPGFEGRRCQALVRAGSRACRACHTSVAELCP
jgi:hypothetical protein